MGALALSLVLTVFLNSLVIDGIIVNGTIAEINEAPYQVQLMMFDQFLCGGSIVGVRHVVSAAHCFNSPSVRQNFKTNMRVNAGSAISFEGDVYSVQDAFIHPFYVDVTLDYDVSVIVILGQFDASHNLKPIPLALDPNIDALAGEMAMVTGFGRVADQGPNSGRMLKLYVPIWNLQTCRQVYQNTERKFCAGFKQGGSGACYGDSGGPLVFAGVMIGIVSGGRVCAEAGSPGLYTNVALVRDWIETIILMN